MDMVIPIIGTHIDCAAGLQNEANMTGAHRTYSDILSNIVSQKFGRGWSVAEPENLRRDVCAFKQRGLCMFLSFSTSGLFTLKFPLLYYLIKDILDVRGYI